MARTSTHQVQLGFNAPDFNLPDVVTNELKTLQSVSGINGTVVMFICNHCPFVVHVLDELVNIGRIYGERGFGFVAVSSNDIDGYPEDSPENMRRLALEKDLPFPYLYDESQEVARSYMAACTPDLSVFNAEGKCVYRGQLDDGRPGNDSPVNGKDLRRTLDLLIAEKQVSTNQRPSVGCNIKWKTGNEPDYY